MKNTYFSTAIGLYFNYLVHGMGVILISLNMSSLEHQWQTNAAGVSIVISSLGIGRLSVLLMAGMLSDRYGRRPFIIFGMICYLIFFVGIINTHSIFIAYAFGFLAGMANSFLDAGTYPQPDGGVSPLTQYSQYINKSLRLQRPVSASHDYQFVGVGRALVWLVLSAGGSHYDTQRRVFVSLSFPDASRASNLHQGITCSTGNPPI